MLLDIFGRPSVKTSKNIIFLIVNVIVTFQE